MSALIATLILYQILLLTIGWWASRRTSDNEDFYLGGRKPGAGIMVSAILSAIMSTADSQLLVAASSVSHDMRNGKTATRESLKLARWVVLLIGIAAISLAIFSPEAIFSRVLFAWQALAAAFGPLLIITLWRGPVRPNWRIAAMSSWLCSDSNPQLDHRNPRC